MQQAEARRLAILAAAGKRGGVSHIKLVTLASAALIITFIVVLAAV